MRVKVKYYLGKHMAVEIVDIEKISATLAAKALNISRRQIISMVKA